MIAASGKRKVAPRRWAEGQAIKVPLTAPAFFMYRRSQVRRGAFDARWKEPERQISLRRDIS